MTIQCRSNHPRSSRCAAFCGRTLRPPPRRWQYRLTSLAWRHVRVFFQAGRERLPDVAGADKQPQQPAKADPPAHQPAPPASRQANGGHSKAAPHPGQYYAPQRGPVRISPRPGRCTTALRTSDSVAVLCAVAYRQGSSSSARQPAPPRSGGSARSRGGASTFSAPSDSTPRSKIAHSLGSAPQVTRGIRHRVDTPQAARQGRRTVVRLRETWHSLPMVLPTHACEPQ